MAENQVLDVTPAALESVLGVRDGSEDTAGMALFVSVDGRSRGAFTYDVAFGPLDDAAPEDLVERFGDLTVIVAAKSVDDLRGAALDIEDGPGGGLTIRNPNPVWASAGGDLAERVSRVLDDDVNPAIAAHGGVVSLVAVEDGTAYLRLGGGCQGCGMATVTLSQGIEVAIRDAIPEIEKIVDVTDHASGSNPYFEPSKK